MRSRRWGWMILWGVSSCSSLRDDPLPGTDAAVEATVVTDTVDLEVEVDVLRVDARSCPGGQVVCGDTCVDRTSSALHCGACGRACDAGQTCVGGACRVTCPPGQTNCTGTCRDLSADYGNCGACGRACDAGQVCSAGACVTSCGRGTTLCGGACVMTATDPGNCGGCGMTCPSRMNASAVCNVSACSFVCSAGAADCDRLAPNGCETSLTMDPSNCGACGRLCSLPQASSACRGGACAVSGCVTGFADCDGNPTNGCEVNLQTSPSNCGMCANTCLLRGACVLGTCACPAGTVSISGGVFTMGDAEFGPAHLVRLSPYCLDQTEVTVEAYTRCFTAGGAGCTAPNTTDFCNWTHTDRNQHPINCVDWNQAAAFCQWMGRRLPTEAEWEFAARGTTGRPFPWGDALPAGQLCWSGVAQRYTTCEVGGFPAGDSPFGIHDMAGNVYEWTADRMGPYAVGSVTPLSNPTGPTEGTNRVDRGGGWADRMTNTINMRATWRNPINPTTRDFSLGFRCASLPR